MASVFASGSSTGAAATTVVLARAPYVTDLTTTGAYINWGITGQQAVGSVMVQPAPGSGVCPTSIAWDPKQQIIAPTTVPLTDVPANTTTTSWSYTVRSTSEWQESVPISGLQPGAQYCYGVYNAHSGTPAQLGSTGTFTTLNPPGSTASLTFDVIGDTGETQSSAGVDYPGFVNPGQQALYREIGTSGAKFLLMAGDVAYSGGTQNNYGDLNQSGDEISDIFGPSSFPLANGIPTFVADGNHGQNSNTLKIWPEPQSALGSSGAYDFNTAAPNNDGITGSFPQDWYAFSDGNVRIYVLTASWADNADGSTANALCANNTTYWSSATDCQGYQADYDQHWTPSSAEYQWLQSDLAAHAGGVKMAVFHYPLRSDEGTQASDPYLLNDPTLNPAGHSSSLESLLAANGVKIAFNGHAHIYERFVPSAPGTVANFITGGGGGILEPVGTSGNPTCKALVSSGSMYAIGWSPTKNQGTACGTSIIPTSAMQVFNYLQVKVTGGQVTVTAYNAQNVAFDQYQFSYNVGGPSAPTAPTNLQGRAASPTEVDLSWSPSSGGSSVAGYKLLRNSTVVGSTSGTSYADTGLSASTSYTYSVEAFDAAGNVSAPSNSIQIGTPAGPQFTFVQSSLDGTGKTLTMPTPTTAGDLLVLSASVYAGSTSTITAVQDSAGDSWTRVIGSNVSGHFSDGEMWYTVAKGSVSSISVTTNASNIAARVLEFSGLGPSPIVTAAGNAGSGTTASASATGSGVAVGFVAGHSSSQAITSSPGFVTQPQETTASPYVSVVTGYNLPASGTQNFDGTFSGVMYWAAGVAVFSP